MPNKWVMALMGVIVGVVLGLFLRAKGVIQYPQMYRVHGWIHILGDGDPPVLVSDGSVFAESDYDWQIANATMLIPNGATTPTGVLMNTCNNMSGYGLVQFYDGKNYWDASPLSGQPLNMTIKHHGQPINVATKADQTNLTLSDPSGHWEKPSGWLSHKAYGSHSDYIDEVSYIDPQTGMSVKHKSVSSSPGNPAHVDFCYK